MNSLDPRVKRLPENVASDKEDTTLALFPAFEVFVQPNPKKPFQHEGAVHAPNLEMSFVMAKEAFTRRFTCSSMYVVETAKIFVSAISEGDQNAFDLIEEPTKGKGDGTSFEIYLLQKRGKQPVHAGQVVANSPEEAMWNARQQLNKGTQVFQVWAMKTDDIRFTTIDEGDLWKTLPEKKFRDASDYQGGDKLKEFLDKSNNL
ncbi:MAG TPA: phenylacetic acid degradation b [Chryseolinea sp.]